MRSRQIVFFLVTGAGILACVLASWQASVTTRNTWAEVAELEEEQKRLEERLRGTITQRSPSQTQPAGNISQGEKPIAPAVSPIGGQAVTLPRVHVTPDEAALIQDPALQVLYFGWKRAEFGISYGPFIRALSLSPTESGRFLDALVQHEANALDRLATGRALNLDRMDPGVVAERERSARERDAAITEILGESGHAVFVDFERTLPARRYASAVAGLAAVSDLPFSPAQVEQLTALIFRHARVSQWDAKTSFSSIDWDAIDNSARSILSPAQWRLFARIDPSGATLSRSKRFTSAAFNAAYQQPATSGAAPLTGSN